MVQICLKLTIQCYSVVFILKLQHILQLPLVFLLLTLNNYPETFFIYLNIDEKRDVLKYPVT